MCDHGFIGACVECDGSGQTPERDAMGETCIMLGCRRPTNGGGLYCTRHDNVQVDAGDFYGDEV